MKKFKELRKEQKGFTLIEVIVVLVIIAIMAALLIPSLAGYIDKAKSDTMKSDASACVKAAQTIGSEVYLQDKSVVGKVTITSLTKAEELSKIPGAVKELAEVKGTVSKVTFNAANGKVTALTYTNNGKSISYEVDKGYGEVKVEEETTTAE